MAEKNIISDEIELRYKNGNAYRQRQLKDLLVGDLNLQAILKAIH